MERRLSHHHTQAGSRPIIETSCNSVLPTIDVYYSGCILSHMSYHVGLLVPTYNVQSHVVSRTVLRGQNLGDLAPYCEIGRVAGHGDHCSLLSQYNNFVAACNPILISHISVVISADNIIDDVNCLACITL